MILSFNPSIPKSLNWTQIYTNKVPKKRTGFILITSSEIRSGYEMKNSELSEKLKSIQLLLLDVDGVLTDSTIIYGHDGSETKIFNVKDGLG